MIYEQDNALNIDDEKQSLPNDEIEETDDEVEEKDEFSSLYPSDEYVFKTSFKSRLHQSSEEAKQYYSDIKNDLLSYNKMKAKVSNDYDTFKVGRDPLVKINLRGKTVYVYLSLDPNELDAKFHVKDVSAKKKFSSVPSLLKVRSDRGAKYALELISKVCEKENLVKDENYEKQDFVVPFLSSKELVDMGLVKPIAKPQFLFGKGFPMTTDVNDDTKTMDSLFDTDAEYDKEDAEEEEDNGPLPSSVKNNVVMVPDADGDKPVSLEFTRSYMARLIQSEDSIKEYYNKVKQAILSYKSVKQTVSWKYESFNKGRTQCAKINVKGKSLYVYLAKECLGDNEKKRNGAKIVGQKQFSKVPVLFKIRDEKSLNKVLPRIETMMSKLGIEALEKPCTEDFRLKNETTKSLIEKGLIKMRVEGGKVELTKEYIQKLNIHGDLSRIIDEKNKQNDEKQEDLEYLDSQIDTSRFGEFTRDLTDFMKDLAKDYDFLPTVLHILKSGDATMSLRKRIMLRAIDETWVRAVEDSLAALDLVIRRPSKFIEEREELVPIELSRSISSRSIQHLSQHTNLISRIEGDTITPSKILNVFRDETMMTYENKFVNSLILNLYIFVSKRYEIALKDGADEKETTIEFHEKFTHGDLKGKIDFKIELDEPIKEDELVDKNYTYTSTLWERVQKINNIVNTYMGSEFVKNMGQAYIRPPVIRTNAILKNRELRQCLTLWEFISSFDETGYELVVKEQLENIDESYIEQLYYAVAAQYIIFRHKINSDFDADETLDAKALEKPFKPRIIDELEEIDTSEFNVKNKITMPSAPKDSAQEIIDSISIALEADKRIRQGKK
ncbi:MAG: DUF2357 domain-containing protein [Clostridia bacterium]|nr:DUF2357 domain-containing protein [Clostridia bacterium]